MAGAAAATPFNGDYRLLAESLLTSIGANVAAGPCSSALKKSPMMNNIMMMLFFSLDNTSTNLSAKFSIPERLKMLNRIVPSLSFILRWKIRFP